MPYTTDDKTDKFDNFVQYNVLSPVVNIFFLCQIL